MLKASPIAGAEEYAIHDYEGFEGVSTLSEYQGVESVAELAAFIAEHGELGGKLVEYFGDLDAAREAIEDHYAGEYQSRGRLRAGADRAEHGDSGEPGILHRLGAHGARPGDQRRADHRDGLRVRPHFLEALICGE
jgi:hypothetical protein